MASLLIYMLFSMTVLAANAPKYNSPYVLDPLNDTAHGIMLSPERMIIKLDCPGCPVYKPKWRTESIALIYDFQIDPQFQDPRLDLNAPQGPAITLNNDTFVPPGPRLGWTPFTRHTSLPVPWYTTIASYLAQPHKYDTADLIAIVDEFPVPNHHGWNLTCIMLTTFAYGTTKEDTFENHWENISVIEVFVQKKNVSSDHGGNGRGMELRSVDNMKEHWTLEWWRIVPVGIMHAGEGMRDNHTAAILPDGLRDKLLGNSTANLTSISQSQIEISSSFTNRISGPWNPFQIWMLMILVTAAAVMLAYCLAVVGTALLGSTGYGCFESREEGRPEKMVMGEKPGDEESLVDEGAVWYCCQQESLLE